jgi:hypothetical protein
MSRSLNKAELIGNVGQDPEVRSTSNGGRVATFSLATSRTWNGPTGDRQEKTEWHRVVVWNGSKGQGEGLADVVEKYVKKGDKIYISGPIEYPPLHRKLLPVHQSRAVGSYSTCRFPVDRPSRVEREAGGFVYLRPRYIPTRNARISSESLARSGRRLPRAQRLRREDTPARFKRASQIVNRHCASDANQRAATLGGGHEGFR